MKKLLALSLVTLSAIQPAMARTENVVIVKAPKGIIEDSSEANRIGKTVTIHGQLVGVGPTSSPSQGIGVGFHVNRNTVILAEVTNNNLNYTFLGSNYETKARSYGIHLKQFLGNSFYVRMGVDQREVNQKYTYRDWLGISSSYTYSRRLQGTSTAASFAIGNQWQWSNFTLGCDWIGFVQPFASDVKESVSDNYSEADRESMRKDKARQFTDGIAQGLRFYLGASF